MNAKRTIACFGLLVVTAISIGWLDRRAPGAVSAQPPPDLPRVRVLPAQDEIARVRDAAPPGAPKRDSAPLAIQAAPPDSIAADEQRSVIVRREIDARLQTLAQAHGNELRDPQWAQSAEKLLRDIAGGPDLPHTKMVRALCKQTLCEVEYTTASPDDYQRLAELADIGGSEGYFSELPSSDGKGPRRLLVYLARAGHGLPALH